MRRITAKFVPRLLSVELKINRVQNQMLQVLNSAQSGSHFISKIIAGSDLAPSDFFFYQIKSHWKARDLMILASSKKIQQKSENRLRKRPTIGAWLSGRIVGDIVFSTLGRDKFNWLAPFIFFATNTVLELFNHTLYMSWLNNELHKLIIS